MINQNLRYQQRGLNSSLVAVIFDHIIAKIFINGISKRQSEHYELLIPCDLQDGLKENTLRINIAL